MQSGDFRQASKHIVRMEGYRGLEGIVLEGIYTPHALQQRGIRLLLRF